jgi:cyclic pyranopterin phosphate synthase
MLGGRMVTPEPFPELGVRTIGELTVPEPGEPFAPLEVDEPVGDDAPEPGGAPSDPEAHATSIVSAARAEPIPIANCRRRFTPLTLPTSLRVSVALMELTHVDAAGAARMVDVSGKPVTVREAAAAARLQTSTAVVDLLRTNGLAKGDALAVARIAGIAGAKRTADLIPLCHPLPLQAVSLELELGADYVDILARTRTTDRTGVEMEALTAVAVAGLALYDMVKAVDRSAVLTDLRLLTKDGGRTGAWVRPDDG